ncbi:MAG: T9SS type A sorting domain-containing protein [Bacteroidia bacterium]
MKKTYYFLLLLCLFFVNKSLFAQCSPINLSVIAAADPDCNIANGAIIVYANGQYPPFSYSWNTGQIGTVAIGLTAGFYQVYVADSIGCTASLQIALENPTLGPDADMLVTDVLCFGEQTGSITLQNLTHYPPYHYTWDIGDTTSQISNVGTGMYNVLVFDSSNCATFLTGVVHAPDSFFVLATPNIQNPNNLMATASALGGTPPYTYQWSNGDAGTLADSLQNGQPYTLTATDANGCKTNHVFTVSLSDNSNPVDYQEIVFFPNPTQGQFQLQTSSVLHFPAQLILYNLNGQKVWKQLWQKADEHFTLPSLPKGLYQLLIYEEKNLATIKVEIE